jgi:hypothetical protein
LLKDGFTGLSSNIFLGIHSFISIPIRSFVLLSISQSRIFFPAPFFVALKSTTVYSIFHLIVLRDNGRM